MSSDETRAVKLWPDNKYLQLEWLRAINVARNTKRGWVAEDHLKGGPDGKRG